MMAINCASLYVLPNSYNIPKQCSNQENTCSRDHPLLSDARDLSLDFYSPGSSISRLSLSYLINDECKFVITYATLAISIRQKK